MAVYTTIEDDEIWATAYYVKHLMEMKEKSSRDQLISKLGKYIFPQEK